VTETAARSGPGALGVAAGTPVHTRDGLKPIESIAAGDVVLSQPEETGERAYKRVVRTIAHEDEPICRLRAHATHDGQFLAQEVLVTPAQPFHVSGYHNDGGFSDEYWAELDKPIGWRRADFIETHQLVQIANGETMQASRVRRIWRTRTPGEGWMEINPDSTDGFRVLVGDGRATVGREHVLAAFSGVDDFDERNAPGLQDKWAYRCPVYELEVEEFHTYYVGEQGLWVRGGAAPRWLAFP
jgi:hypothetical protein